MLLDLQQGSDGKVAAAHPTHHPRLLPSYVLVTHSGADSQSFFHNKLFSFLPNHSKCDLIISPCSPPIPSSGNFCNTAATWWWPTTPFPPQSPTPLPPPPDVTGLVDETLVRP